IKITIGYPKPTVNPLDAGHRSVTEWSCALLGRVSSLDLGVGADCHPRTAPHPLSFWRYDAANLAIIALCNKHAGARRSTTKHLPNSPVGTPVHFSQGRDSQATDPEPLHLHEGRPGRSSRHSHRVAAGRQGHAR